MRLLLATALILAALTAPANAQLIAAKDAPIAMGHLHLNVSDMAAHKRFWVDVLGAEAVTLGNIEVIKYPNALIFLREQKPTDGTKGSSVDHIGIQFPDVPAMVSRVRAAGVPVVTTAEISGGRAKGDIFFTASQNTYLAFIMAPDNLKIEMFENRALETPIANHHIHFASHEVKKMQAWYDEMFGATPMQRGPFEAGDMPGVNLTYTPTETPTAPTKGRVLDHIGFEIKNLKSFCEKLEKQGVKFDRAFQEVPKLGISVAFLTDPWGTYVELTEGLDKL
ncbi:MAG TPA: VOC family protein [Bryobacterales bacterium]|nr:VOC family protein [Bryobacterales bacterium]